MNVPTRLAAFAVLLAVVFGGAALAGAAIDPTDDPPATHDGGHRDDPARSAHRDGATEPADRGGSALRGHAGEQHPAGRPSSEEAPR